MAGVRVSRHHGPMPGFRIDFDTSGGRSNVDALRQSIDALTSQTKLSAEQLATWNSRMAEQDVIRGATGAVDAYRKSQEELAKSHGLSEKEAKAMGERAVQNAQQLKEANSSATLLNTSLSGLATRIAGAAGAFVTLRSASQFFAESTTLAARYDTLGVVLHTVGANAGYAASYVDGLTGSLQRSGIAMNSSRQALSQMIQGHMDLANATKLSRAAQDAAVIGGVNSSEAFTRMTTAIQTAQPEMLRTLGINVNFSVAYQKMAATLHTTTEALTENEKMMARSNATMEATKTIAGTYEAAMGTAGKQAFSLERYWENFKTSLGQGAQPGYSALIEGATAAIKDFTTTVKDPSFQESMKQWGESLGNVAKHMAEIAKHAGLRSVNSTFSQGVDLAAKGKIDMDKFIHSSFLERQKMVDSVNIPDSRESKTQEILHSNNQGIVLQPGELERLYNGRRAAEALDLQNFMSIYLERNKTFQSTAAQLSYATNTWQGERGKFEKAATLAREIGDVQMLANAERGWAEADQKLIQTRAQLIKADDDVRRSIESMGASVQAEWADLSGDKYAGVGIKAFQEAQNELAQLEDRMAGYKGENKEALAATGRMWINEKHRIAEARTELEKWKDTLSTTASLLSDLGRLSGSPEASYQGAMLKLKGEYFDAARSAQALGIPQDLVDQTYALKARDAWQTAYKGLGNITGSSFDTQRALLSRELEDYRKQGADITALRVYAAQRSEEIARDELQSRQAYASSFTDYLKNQIGLEAGLYQGEHSRQLAEWQDYYTTIKGYATGFTDTLKSGIADGLEGLFESKNPEDAFKNMLASMRRQFLQFIVDLAFDWAKAHIFNPIKDQIVGTSPGATAEKTVSGAARGLEQMSTSAPGSQRALEFFQQGAPTIPSADESLLAGYSKIGAIKLDDEATHAMRALGSISGKYESGGNYGLVSTGDKWGDPGGVSYGKYQLSSVRGSLDEFLKTSGFTDHPAINSDAFKSWWKQQAQTTAFQQAQESFATEKFYKPVAAHLKTMGYDAGNDPGVQEMLMAMANAHGVGGADKVLDRSLRGFDLSFIGRDDLIRAVYAERMKGPGESLDYWRSSPATVQASVKRRLGNEMQDVLSSTGDATSASGILGEDGARAVSSAVSSYGAFGGFFGTQGAQSLISKLDAQGGVASLLTGESQANIWSTVNQLPPAALTLGLFPPSGSTGAGYSPFTAAPNMSGWSNWFKSAGINISSDDFVKTAASSYSGFQTIDQNVFQSALSQGMAPEAAFMYAMGGGDIITISQTDIASRSAQSIKSSLSGASSGVHWGQVNDLVAQGVSPNLAITYVAGGGKAISPSAAQQTGKNDSLGGIGDMFKGNGSWTSSLDRWGYNNLGIGTEVPNSWVLNSDQAAAYDYWVANGGDPAASWEAAANQGGSSITGGLGSYASAGLAGAGMGMSVASLVYPNGTGTVGGTIGGTIGGLIGNAILPGIGGIVGGLLGGVVGSLFGGSETKKTEKTGSGALINMTVPGQISSIGYESYRTVTSGSFGSSSTSHTMKPSLADPALVAKFRETFEEYTNSIFRGMVTLGGSTNPLKNFSFPYIFPINDQYASIYAKNVANYEAELVLTTDNLKDSFDACSKAGELYVDQIKRISDAYNEGIAATVSAGTSLGTLSGTDNTVFQGDWYSQITDLLGSSDAANSFFSVYTSYGMSKDEATQAQIAGYTTQANAAIGTLNQNYTTSDGSQVTLDNFWTELGQALQGPLTAEQTEYWANAETWVKYLDDALIQANSVAQQLNNYSISLLQAQEQEIQVNEILPIQQRDERIQYEQIAPLQLESQQIQAEQIDPINQLIEQIKTEIIEPLNLQIQTIKTNLIEPLTLANQEIKTNVIEPLELINQQIKTEIINPLNLEIQTIKTTQIEPLQLQNQEIQVNQIEPLNIQSQELKLQAEPLQLQQQINSYQIQVLQDQLTAAQSVKVMVNGLLTSVSSAYSTYNSIFQSLRSTVQGIQWNSSLSPNTPTKTFDEQQEYYNQLLAKVNSEDASSITYSQDISNLQSFAQTYLQTAKSYYGASTQYYDIYGSVTSTLSDLEGKALDETTILQSQLAAQNELVNQNQTVIDTLTLANNALAEQTSAINIEVAKIQLQTDKLNLEIAKTQLVIDQLTLQNSYTQLTIDNQELIISQNQSIIDKESYIISQNQQQIDKLNLQVAYLQLSVDKESLQVQELQLAVDKLNYLVTVNQTLIDEYNYQIAVDQQKINLIKLSEQGIETQIAQLQLQNTILQNEATQASLYGWAGVDAANATTAAITALQNATSTNLSNLVTGTTNVTTAVNATTTAVNADAQVNNGTNTWLSEISGQLHMFDFFQGAWQGMINSYFTPTVNYLSRIATNTANLSAISSHAGGGPVATGEWSWVGERGPELVKFGQYAHVYTHQQSKAFVASSSSGGSVSSDGSKAIIATMMQGTQVTATGFSALLKEFGDMKSEMRQMRIVQERMAASRN